MLQNTKSSEIRTDFKKGILFFFVFFLRTINNYIHWTNCHRNTNPITRALRFIFILNTSNNKVNGHHKRIAMVSNNNQVGGGIPMIIDQHYGASTLPRKHSVHWFTTATTIPNCSHKTVKVWGFMLLIPNSGSSIWNLSRNWSFITLQ